MLYKPSVTSDKELQALKEMAEMTGLNTLTSAIETHKMEADLDTLLHVHCTRENHSPRPNWYTPILISVIIILSLGLTMQISYPYYVAGIKRCRSVKNPQNPISTPTKEAHPSPTPTVQSAETESTQTRVHLARYGLQAVCE